MPFAVSFSFKLKGSKSHGFWAMHILELQKPDHQEYRASGLLGKPG